MISEYGVLLIARLVNYLLVLDFNFFPDYEIFVQINHFIVITYLSYLFLLILLLNSTLDRRTAFVTNI